MNTTQNWLSEGTGKRLDLEKMQKKELIEELLYTEKKYEGLLGEWEKQFEQKRVVVKQMIQILSTFGAGSFDAETEKEEMEESFSGLFETKT